MQAPARFQYKGKSVFLTYSQCPLTKERVLEFLKTVGQLEKAAVGQETHQDGNFHIHVCAWYTQELRSVNCRFLDIDGYHPNIRGTRVQNKKAAMAYVSKQDSNVLCHNMDIQAEQAARAAHRKILGKRLMDGEDLLDVI